jgi:hypothetical protein
VIGAILSSETPDAKAAALGIQLVNTVDPPQTASVEVSGDLSMDAVNQMSYSQLLAVAQAYNIDLTRDDQGAIEGPTPLRPLPRLLNQAVQKPSSPLLVEEEASLVGVLCDPSPGGAVGYPRERGGGAEPRTGGRALAAGLPDFGGADVLRCERPHRAARQQRSER